MFRLNKSWDQTQVLLTFLINRQKGFFLSIERSLLGQRDSITPLWLIFEGFDGNILIHNHLIPYISSPTLCYVLIVFPSYRCFYCYKFRLH